MIPLINVFSFSSPTKPHLAVLTDGRVFTFYHCYNKQVWATEELSTNSDTKKAVVLGILNPCAPVKLIYLELLVEWVAGNNPFEMASLERIRFSKPSALI